MFVDYFLLALKNLRKRGLRSWLTILGVFIGIAAVVSLISLGQGLQEAIIGQFSTLNPNKLIVENAGTGFGPPGSSAIKKLTKNDLDLIKSVDGVEFAIPRLIRVVTADLGKDREFIFVTSLPANEDEIDVIKNSLNLRINKGRFLNADDRKKIIVGIHLKEDHFNGKLKLGKKIKLQGEVFEIIGILERSGSFIINSIIILPEEDLKDILDLGDEIDLIVVQTENNKNITKIAKEIEDKLRKDRNLDIGEEDFSVQTPLQSLSTINNILGVINIVVVGIAIIALIIGGIGIANTMYTSVLERTKEIGVMKAIGAKNSDIIIIFLIESGLLGMIGGIIGIALGFGLAFGISLIAGTFLEVIDLKIKFSLVLTLVAIIFSVLIGVISGVAPALQASRLNPVESLRK